MRRTIPLTVLFLLCSLAVSSHGDALPVAPGNDPAPPVLRPSGAAGAAAYGAGATERPSLEGDPVAYLVLTPEAFVDSVQDLLDWKNRSGTPAQVRTVEWVLANYPDGVDAPDRIRGFLREAHAYWGTRWVLVIGGPDQVPVRKARSYAWNCPDGVDIITDLYYAALDGNWNKDGDGIFGEPLKQNCPLNPIGDAVDFDAELHVGRIPAESPREAAIWIRKLLAYVQTPDLTGSLDRMLFLGEVLFSTSWTRAELPDCGRCTETQCPHCVSLDGAEDCIRAIEVLEESPDPDRSFTELYEWFEYWNEHGRPNAQLEIQAEVIGKMNEGFGWIHHVGHGEIDRWSVGTRDGLDGNGRVFLADAAALTNGDRTGVAYSIDCWSANWEPDCLSEALLFNPAGGAIGVIGSTNLDFPAAARSYQEGHLRRLFVEGRSIGESFYATTSERMSGMGENDNYTRFLAYALTLLGDPQMTVWRGTPAPLSVDAQGTIALGDSLLAVAVAREGSPLAGATVCATKRDAHETLHAVAVTGVDGVAMVPFRPTWPGTFGLTVTEAGSIPHVEGLDTREVLAAEGSDGSVVAIAIRDPETGSMGNGDGRLEEGEAAVVDVTVRNGGTSPSAGGEIRLRIGPAGYESYLEVQDGLEPVPPLGPGEETTLAGAFRVRTVPPIPDEAHQNGDRVPFSAIVGFALGEDEEEFELPLPCDRPFLLMDACALEELPGGNGDGAPDVGETFAWTPVVRNVGAGSTENLACAIEAVSGMTVLDGTATMGSAGEHETIRAAHPLRFRVDAPQPAGRVRLHSALQPAFVFLDRGIEFEPPEAPAWGDEQVEQGAHTLRLVWSESPAADLEGYLLERAREDEAFERATGMLVRGMRTLEDTGLEPLTEYRYRVAAVDSSGNPGAWSDTLLTTTIPGFLPGWPVSVRSDATLGCPTIADLDGLPGREVFISADRLYAYRADGGEVIDGDQDVSTRGVWSDLGASFWNKPAVADLDGDGSPEVVAASRYRDDDDRIGTLLVWGADGSFRWSRQVGVSNFLLGSPVCADIGGDAALEIVVQNRGCLYAWRADGSPVIPGNSDGKLAYVGGANEEDPATWPYAYGSPAAADVDGDGDAEILLGLQTNLADSRSRLVLVDGDGTFSPPRIWRSRREAATRPRPTPPLPWRTWTATASTRSSSPRAGPSGAIGASPTRRRWSSPGATRSPRVSRRTGSNRRPASATSTATAASTR